MYRCETRFFTLSVGTQTIGPKWEWTMLNDEEVCTVHLNQEW